MICTKCGTSNPPANNFCAHCGSALVRVCVNYKAESPSTSNFCGRCGASLGESASSSVEPPEHASIQIAAPSTNEHLTGERKTVTALFADIEGSTELMRNLDPEEARAIVDPALRIMVEAVRRYDGYVVQSTGDGIFALFGAPLAHEDHPQRALYAALQMQQELRGYRQQLAALGRPMLEARIGVNTGEVVVRTIDAGERTEYTPIGHTANLASRLQTVGPIGSISVSEDTRKLVEGYFELRALGPIAIKGISEPINVFEVIGLGALRSHFELAARRGLTRFVGRDGELGQMDRALERAMGRHGQIVAVVAEAGTGKSRLFYEFKATIPAECKVLEAYSVSHGKASAWLPVLELLRKYFGFGSTDDAATRRQKVTAVLKALDPSLTDALPYLFGLLGIVEGDDPLAQMDGQVKKRRTLDAIKRIILRESLIQPLVVIFEDLHWFDGQTQDFLNLLADSIGTAKILVLVNYRPEYSHQWGSKTSYTQLRLDPLEREGAEQMLSALLGDGVEVAALKRVIIEKTDGNPFFIEETVQVLFDEGALVLDGRIKLTKPLAELKIPPTVQAILASRIDRSPRDVKELLQTLAVIGREFPLSLIRAVVAKPDDQLHHLLNDLQLGEFIYEQPTVGENEYIFKHALTQEVAYGSVLIERRRQLHDRIGSALEKLYASSIDDHLAELAHHYGHTNNPEKAVQYHALASEQALSRAAFNEALSLGRAGLALVPELAVGAESRQREFGLLSTLVRAASAIEGYGSAQTAMGSRRMLEIARESGDETRLFTALHGMWMEHNIAARHQEAMELASQMAQAAERRNSQAALADALTAQGWTMFLTGHHGDALAALVRAIAICRDGAGRTSIDGNVHLFFPWSVRE